MASIVPFCGVRYNAKRIADLSAVITQPYDRIGPDLRERYLRQHPHNFVRLILSDADPHQPQAGNPYSGVAALYQDWLREGVLLRSSQPALYVYRQTFSSPDGTPVTRRALLAALELTPFGEGTVLPHERTLSAPKADRLNLFRSTRVSFEPVFMLYADAENRVNDLLDADIEGRLPDADVHEAFESDVRHQLWEVTAPSVIAQVQANMAPKRNLIVADGHHRYETALNYRAEMRLALPDAPPDAPFNFALTALVSTDDPALTILPTHRLVHSYDRLNAAELESAAAQYFDIEPVPSGGGSATLTTALRAAGRTATAFGLSVPHRQSLWVLRDRRIMDALAPNRTLAWRALDVAVLHELVLGRIMGLTPDSIARQENLIYLRDAEAGRRALERGEAQFLFQLNPTRVDQVRACAEAGERMPQKSTDFYPKMVSGLVLMEL